MRDGEALSITLPPAVAGVLAALQQTGSEAVLVGGCVRDLVQGEGPVDWDIATAAPPEAVAGLFPGSTWENAFGTVTVVHPGGEPGIEVTTYRVEAGYRDRRRPDAVIWGTSLTDDLARRDFTINAMAWLPEDVSAGAGSLVDPFAGAADLEAGLLRAVGDADARLEEDALRLIRGVRLASRFDLRLDPPTEEAIRRHAPDAAGLSGERVHDELMRILSDPAPPSRAFALMEHLRLLEVLLPELAALRGVPQNKPLAGDALDHSLRAVDALPASDPVLRLAGLLHDLGKATTRADGHFLQHEQAGERQAGQVMLRLRAPRIEMTRVGRLVLHHMFTYTPDWTDAAVRRFVRRVGADLLPDLFALRAADDAASGVRDPAIGGWEELRRRATIAIARDPLEAKHLALTGDDLVAELGIRPGPAVGRLLAALLDAVLEDPTLNSRDRLLELARAMASG
ncbi:MAG: CCA tRNA nucleotidyltransferase [Chloroflexota bacterium]|nr:CCA tRNA nucleotidyltransferase [Chloroflexota bacterium]